MIQKKRLKQNIGEFEVKRSNNILRKISPFDVMFTAIGGYTILIVLQAIFGFHILGMR